MYAAIVLLPLVGALVSGLGRGILGDRGAQAVTVGAMGIAMVLGVLCFFDVAVGGRPQTILLFEWIHVGTLEADWALKLDTLSAVMILVVTVVSFLVHVYSIGYMHHDPSIPRFMAYLNLFTFFMLALVTADNFVQMFFGWEGVGLSSYLLIGFWYERPAANAAAIKAFVVNRIGDFGFSLGIMGTFFLFDSVVFETVFASAPDHAETAIHFLGGEFHALTVICLLLFMGAMGKSAQFLLHTWLPDAMEGPTPVSALIHAATMVTAGVFMVARLSPMFEYAPVALDVVAFIGATTCFFAATIGITQNDIKRVVAYSTCSQLGYMFFAAGVSAYPAAIFHLTTHAFFKALLFLGAGSIIHAMSDEQDMRRMGGLWRHIKITYVCMWIGSLALAGIPLFAGYYSKDMIIEAAYASGSAFGPYAFTLGVIAALLTSLYSWRLIFMTFHGEPRADEKTMAHVHESPWVMLVPMLVLAVGAVFAGMLGYNAFVGDGREAFWGDSILVLRDHDSIEAAHHHLPLWAKLAPLVVAVIGIALAWRYYIARPEAPKAVVAMFRDLYLFLYNKWYFDEIYRAIFVRPAFAIGRFLWRQGDGTVIDGLGPDGISATCRRLADKVGLLQSGYLYHYAFAMMIGVVALVSFYLYAIAV